eukprot:3613852-Amphidinium_carterae.1
MLQPFGPPRSWEHRAWMGWRDLLGHGTEQREVRRSEAEALTKPPALVSAVSRYARCVLLVWTTLSCGMPRTLHKLVVPVGSITRTVGKNGCRASPFSEDVSIDLHSVGELGLALAHPHRGRLCCLLAQ